MTDPVPPTPFPVVREIPAPGPTPARLHPTWAELFPWLAQGVTERGDPGSPEDFALSPPGAVQGGDSSCGTAPGPDPSPGASARWGALARQLGFSGVVGSRQLHGREVLHHTREPQGLQLGPPADGHLTRAPGILVGVTVADCVPVYLVDPLRRAAALLHAGWRGVAEGILDVGVGALTGGCGDGASSLYLHLGPSICGRCYEVGPEVHRALGLADPGRPAPVDLRWRLAVRGVELGIPREHVTLSGYCTLCGDPPFFSHRRGDPQRQLAFLGIRRDGSW